MFQWRIGTEVFSRTFVSVSDHRNPGGIRCRYLIRLPSAEELASRHRSGPELLGASLIQLLHTKKGMNFKEGRTWKNYVKFMQLHPNSMNYTYNFIQIPTNSVHKFRRFVPVKPYTVQAAEPREIVRLQCHGQKRMRPHQCSSCPCSDVFWMFPKIPKNQQSWP